MATQRQQKLLKLLLENLGNTKETKSAYKMLKEAGYSDAQAKNPKQILESETIQAGVSDFLKQLDDKRRRAITQITDEKLEKASARDNAYIADILTKNHQLLSGEETERQGVQVNVVNYGDDTTQV